MKKRKQLTMRLIVTVPVGMSAAEARREVRTNINDHSMMWSDDWDQGDIKVRGLKPLPNAKD